MTVRLTAALAAAAALLTFAVIPQVRGNSAAVPRIASASFGAPDQATEIKPAVKAALSSPIAAIDLRNIALRDSGRPASSEPMLALTEGAGPGQPATALWGAWPVRHLNVSFSPLISDAAARTGLPYDFLYRLLRQESGLRADAISPKGALGIAQFMPATALERGLTNPFDPSQAVIKAAELLRDHWVRFGSLGLAAAAYNAGPGRVEKWLAGLSGMPQETRDYVQIVTGRTVEGWAPAGRWASLERGPDQMTLSGPGLAVRSPTMPGALSLHPLAERPTSHLKAGKAGPRRIEARRLDATARSEDELCALVGGQSNACIVRRTY